MEIPEIIFVRIGRVLLTDKRKKITERSFYQTFCDVLVPDFSDTKVKKFVLFYSVWFNEKVKKKVEQ